MEREEPRLGSESRGFLSQPCPDLLDDLRKLTCTYKMSGLGHIDLEPQFPLWQPRIWKNPDTQIP